jgi:hypothetical protein
MAGGLAPNENQGFTFEEPFSPDMSQFKASKAFGPTIAPVNPEKPFSFQEGPTKEPARNLEDYKKDPSRGYTFGTRGEQLAEAQSPIVRQALSGLGSFGEGFSNWFDYIPAAGAKGLGYAGVPRYESYKDMPISDIKNVVKDILSTSRKEYPKTGTAGTVAGITANMATMPAVIPKAGAVPSAMATGTTYGLSEGLAENLDPSEAIRSAVIGTVAGGTLTPILEKTIGKFAQLLPSGRNIIDHNGILSKEAADIAREAGLSDNEIMRLGPQIAANFEKYGMRPEAARVSQFEQFGITPTQGMVTKNPEALEREQKISSSNAPYAQPTYERIRQQASDAALDLTGRPVSPQEAVDVAVQSARDKAIAAKTEANQAYTDASNMGGFFPRDSITNIGQNISYDMGRDSKLTNFLSNDSVQKAIKRLDDTLGAEIPISGPLVPGGKPITTVHQDFNAVETGRQALNAELTAAMQRGDGEAIRGIHEVIDRFDNHIEDQLTKGAFSGDPAVVDKWKEARGLWSDYKTKYGTKGIGDESGNLLKMIVDQKATPESIGNAIFNYSGGDVSMKTNAMRTISQLNRALGPNSPEMQGIKSSFVNRLMTPSSASPESFAKTAAQINEFLDGKGQNIARRFLSPEETAVLRRFSNVMEHAGSMPEDQLRKNVSLIAETARMAAPAALNGAGWFLGMVHPVLAASLAAVGYIPKGIALAKKAPYFVNKAANAPFQGKGPLPQIPSVRVGVPTALRQYPDQSESALDQANQSTQQITTLPMTRASGGRTNKDPKNRAIQLMLLADRIKKEQGNETKPLLNLDDTTVAKALAIANRGI